MTSDLPPPGPEATPTADHPEPRRPRRTGRDRPNYAARRVAAASVVIAVIAVIVGVVMIVNGDDELDVAVEPGWDTIVEVTRTSGAVVVLDEDGEEIDRLDGTGRMTELHVRQDRLALVGADQVVVRGLDPDGEVSTIEIDPAASVVRHPSNRSFVLLVTPEVGGEIVVIDADAATTTAIGARAGQRNPLLLAETLRVDRDADRFAVGDGRNFQTIVVDADPDVEPAFFPGVPMAISDDVVVTSTNVGRTAELGFFDADGERRALIETERPFAGVLDGNRFVYVTEDGVLLEAEPGQSEPGELGDLGLRDIVDAVPALGGRRLVITGAQRLVVVDLDGDVLHDVEVDGAGEADLRPWHTWRCLPVPGTVNGDGLGSIVDLGDGEIVARFPAGAVRSVTTDGCGVHVRTEDGDVIATRVGTYETGDTWRTVVLSPDGTAAIVVDDTGRAELVSVEDSRRLDLGTRRGQLAFAQR